MSKKTRNGKVKSNVPETDVIVDKQTEDEVETEQDNDETIQNGDETTDHEEIEQNDNGDDVNDQNGDEPGADDENEDTTESDTDTDEDQTTDIVVAENNRNIQLGMDLKNHFVEWYGQFSGFKKIRRFIEDWKDPEKRKNLSFKDVAVSLSESLSELNVVYNGIDTAKVPAFLWIGQASNLLKELYGKKRGYKDAILEIIKKEEPNITATALTMYMRLAASPSIETYARFGTTRLDIIAWR